MRDNKSQKRVLHVSLGETKRVGDDREELKMTLGFLVGTLDKDSLDREKTRREGVIVKAEGRRRRFVGWEEEREGNELSLGSD